MAVGIVAAAVVDSDYSVKDLLLCLPMAIHQNFRMVGHSAGLVFSLMIDGAVVELEAVFVVGFAQSYCFF